MTEILFREEVYQIIGAAMEVHSVLGSGFLEPVYQEALEWEMSDRGIPYQAQRPFRIAYKQRILMKEYISDLVCFEAIVVELKALNQISDRERSQLLNYLKASALRVGVLINFGSVGKLEWQRMVR